MNRAAVILLTLFLLLAASHRLPAPISEDAVQKPTPAPQASAKPKVKHSKPKVKSEEGSAKTKSAESASSTPRPSGSARNLTGPSPQYPPEAVPQQLSGRGQYLLHFDQATGNVIDVTVVQSTGSPLLDQASITAFRQWHEDPNCAKEVTMTMTFTKQGETE